MDIPSEWHPYRTTFDGETWDVFRRGSGTGVIVLHELPGLSPAVFAFADEVVARGHTVLVPRLFGQDRGFSLVDAARDVRRFCVRREFTLFARGRTSRVVTWLRALARDLHDDVGGPGVGVVGMCFTGGFALAMVADAPVIAPVLAEPSLPLPVGVLPGRAASRGRDLGLSSEDLDAVRASSCAVLGVRYQDDWMTGTRFDTLRAELGTRFTPVQFPGSDHSVLTGDRQEAGVREVLDFLDANLEESS